jgi:hypothetical protein
MQQLLCNVESHKDPLLFSRDLDETLQTELCSRRGGTPVFYLGVSV